MAFNFMQKWDFPSNNYGQIYGIADSGVETFKGTPIKSLAREICQNSLDAMLNKNPVKVEFKLFEIEMNDIPGYDDLHDALKQSLDFWSTLQEDKKAETFFRKAISTIKKEKNICLRISDFNTSGLTGSRKEYNSNWCNLIKSSGASDKSGKNGGSFGIGKFAPFACSNLRTVFYSTSDIEGQNAFQGVSRLTSFKNKRGEITQGTGYYGNDKCSPAYRQLMLDPSFNRTKSGTDIYILGFNGDKDWQTKMVVSILDGFLYAVFRGDLVVDVDGVVIKKEVLPELMEEYKDKFDEYAYEYYQAMTDEKLHRRFEKDTTGLGLDGKLYLDLMIKPDFHRRVAMVRQTGMKIKDKRNISGLIPFSGVLYIEGDGINSYLRSLENPQHLEWEIERAENKTEAKRVLTYLRSFIKESLEEMKNDDGEEELDPSVGEYLSDIQDDAANNKEKKENIQDNIEDIRVHVSNVPPSSDPSGKEGAGSVDDENGEEEGTDLPGEGGRGSQGSGGGGGEGGGANPGDGEGNVPIPHRKKLMPVAPSSVRSIMRDKSNGEYTIIFKPSRTAQNGVVNVFMAAESQNYDAPILSAVCAGQNIEIKGNKISGISFIKGEAIQLNIKLDYQDYCSLEVKAYGN